MRAAVCMQQINQPSPSAAARSADVRHRRQIKVMAAVCMRTNQPSTSAAVPSADVREDGAAVCMQKILQPSKSAAAQSADVR